MKKTGFLLIMLMAVAASGQQTTAAPATPIVGPDGTMPNSISFPLEIVEKPTYSDLACAGFISKQLVPNSRYVSGGLQTPNTTKYANGELIYLTGKDYQLGQQYEIVRELKDPNRYELFEGQHAMLKTMGQPYSELGHVRVIDTRSKSAVAQIEFSCEPIVPGDFVVPYTEKAPISSRPPVRFDRFLPATSKTSGRIVMGKDFDGSLGTGMKVYMNVGSNQGVKAGDYFHAFRNYEKDLHDPVDSLSFKASTSEDTQLKQASIEQHMFTQTGGPVVHVRDLPRRAVGEIVVLSTTPTSSTGMIVFSMEDIHLGDGVELDAE
jgi:hypothetical protein